MQTVFTQNITGYYSLGSKYSRYYQDDTNRLVLTSGIQIASGARINSVTFRCSNISVWKKGTVSRAYFRLDGVSFCTPAWPTYGDNQDLTLYPSNDVSIYAGKTAFTFFAGWDSPPTIESWCSFRKGGELVLTVDWDAADDISTCTQDVTAGNTASVTTSDSGYTHTAVWAFGTHSSSVSMAAHITEASFTFPAAWLDTIPNSMTGNGTLTLITLSGSAEIGRVSRSVTFRCPPSPPLVTNLQDNASGKYGDFYLRGVTSIAPTVSAAARHYGTIAGVSFNLSPGTLTTAGTFTLTATVTDSRGQVSALSCPAFTVRDYALPALTVNQCNRCTAEGVDADDGTAVKARATVLTTEDGYTNALSSLTFSSKLASDTSFGTEQLLTNAAQSILTYRTFETAVTYDVRFTATDTVGGQTSVVLRINVTGYKLYLRSDGTGAAFGKACERENALEIPASWDIYRGKTKLSEVPFPVSLGGTGASTAAGAIAGLGILQAVYPVGAIYLSTVSTSPAALFGFGTWEQITDRFLLASTASSYGIGTTGGSASHRHSLSANGGAAIRKYANIFYQGNNSGAGRMPSDGNGNWWLTTANSDSSSTSPDYTKATGVALYGNTDTAASLPPYYTVYCWKRTA